VLVAIAIALLLWRFVLSPPSSMSAFSGKDLPSSMRLNPNEPHLPITGPIPMRPGAPR
jgi:hypothetical protein